MSGQVSVVPIQRRQSLIANVVRACGKCGAPGVFHAVEGVNPGCYDPLRVNHPVGDTCPNCGASRVAVESHGEIWFREWRVGAWAVLKDAFWRFFNPRKGNRR